MIEDPDFGNYLNWQDRGLDEQINEPLRDWLLERLPYELTNPSTKNFIDLRDIGELAEGQWSAYAGRNDAHYFFELESDAMAFKLKWM